MKTIPSYVSPKDVIYLKYSACCCLRILLFNGYAEMNSDLFFFLDFNKEGTIYNDALNHNKKFINNIQEYSEMFLYLLQLNSGSAINLLSSKLSARISMLNSSQVKSHLLSSISQYGIRINSNSHFNAVNTIETRITSISEIKLFSGFLSDISTKDDFLYIRRFKLANLFKHEQFGHIKFALNFLLYNIYENKSIKIKIFEPLSPIRYYKIYEEEGFVEITTLTQKDNGEEEIMGESGLSIEFFLTRGNIKLLNVLRLTKIHAKQLFEHPELMANRSLNQFINILKKEEKEIHSKEIFKTIKSGKFCLLAECEGKYFGFPRREKYDL